jgi:hydroxyethylthiazole kinase
MQEQVAELAMVLAQVRAWRPLLHYLPTWVTDNDVANMALAVGASPIMAVVPEEVRDIQSDALGLNLGTPHPPYPWNRLYLCGSDCRPPRSWAGS